MSPEQQTGGGGRRAFLVAGTEQAASVSCAVHGQQAPAPGAQIIVVDPAGPKGEGAAVNADGAVDPDAGAAEKVKR